MKGVLYFGVVCKWFRHHGYGYGILRRLLVCSIGIENAHLLHPVGTQAMGKHCGTALQVNHQQHTIPPGGCQHDTAMLMGAQRSLQGSYPTTSGEHASPASPSLLRLTELCCELETTSPCGKAGCLYLLPMEAHQHTSG